MLTQPDNISVKIVKAKYIKNNKDNFFNVEKNYTASSTRKVSWTKEVLMVIVLLFGMIVE